VFISNAYAASAAPIQEWTSFLPLIVIAVLFYFMLIRPQVKQAKDHRTMLEGIQKGDEVATAGGIVGKVVKVTDSFVSIEITAETIVHVQKHAIQTLLPKGTLKNL
jgi:preprotein translocase subunit YajC